MWKNKILDVFVVFLIVAFGFFFFDVVRANKTLEARVAKQEAKTSSLITELGQAKDENHAVYEKFLETVIAFEQSIDSEADTLSLAKTASVTSKEAPVEAPTASASVAQQDSPTSSPPQAFLIVGQHKRLADSIVVAFASKEEKTVTLVSIPRDLFVNGRKINEYLSLYDITTLKQKVEIVIGMPIQGYLVQNFQAFEKIVDTLGGVDIAVPKDIYDTAYPDGNGNYETYFVQAGAQHMDGAEALKYSRSRHSTSDFDRAQRQQQILRALQERVINFDFLNHLDAIQSLYDSVQNAIETNISLVDFLQYLKQFQDFTIKGGNVISTANLLYSSKNIAGQSIVIPRSGNFVEIQDYIKDLAF